MWLYFHSCLKSLLKTHTGINKTVILLPVIPLHMWAVSPNLDLQSCVPFYVKYVFVLSMGILFPRHSLSHPRQFLDWLDSCCFLQGLNDKDASSAWGLRVGDSLGLLATSRHSPFEPLMCCEEQTGSNCFRLMLRSTPMSTTYSPNLLVSFLSCKWLPHPTALISGSLVLLVTH